MGKKINIVGNKYGKLTVIEELKERTKQGKILCKCLCECGEYCIIKKINLTKGKTKSCGCSKYTSAINDDDFIGKKFGEFTVLSKVENSKIRKYKCQCSCGSIKEVNAYNLKDGLSTNCGCKRKETLGNMFKKDIKGQKFGKLTVIKECGSNAFGKNTWLCKCECGNETIVTTGSLNSGSVISCGCINSIGNYILASTLKELNVNFKTEYYVDLTNSNYNAKSLRFDAFLPEYNVAIEYDGEQHFRPVERFGGEEAFNRNVERDKIKNKYCIENGIILYRINYKDMDIMEQIIYDIVNELIITNND